MDSFGAILEEVKALHDRKERDYGTDEDPLANFRGSTEFGVRPWVGALIRAADKDRRIKAFIRKGKLENESLEDSLLDRVVYSMIALDLYRQDQKRSQSQEVLPGQTMYFDMTCVCGDSSDCNECD